MTSRARRGVAVTWVRDTGELSSCARTDIGRLVVCAIGVLVAAVGTDAVERQPQPVPRAQRLGDEFESVAC
jgi:hypothetical protein